MSAIRSDPAAVEDQDARQVDNRTHPMRDDDHRSPVALAEQFPVDRPCGWVVELGGRFIQNQDRTIEQHGAGENQPLPFPGREPASPFADDRVETSGRALVP